MKTLALELSTALGSVAWLGADGASTVRKFPADRKHSGLFYENLSDLCRDCGLPEVIVVGLGPGSYAGVRIAIATALGLRIASSARLLGLPSICAFDCARYCVIGDARRSSYFFARVQDGNCIEGPCLLSEEELQAKLDDQCAVPVFASQPLPQFARVETMHPSAVLLAALAQKSDLRSDEPLEPIYLRTPYITTPKTIPWIR